LFGAVLSLLELFGCGVPAGQELLVLGAVQGSHFGDRCGFLLGSPSDAVGFLLGLGVACAALGGLLTVAVDPREQVGHPLGGRCPGLDVADELGDRLPACIEVVRFGAQHVACG
jgi:hypothetical protein